MRRPDWETRLARVLEDFRSAPFAWGHTDCFMLARAAVLAETGQLLFPDGRPYRSPRAAAIRLARHGFADAGAALAAALPETAASLARRGDVGTVREDGAAACVVVLGRDLAGVCVPGGLTILPRERLVRAFRVD